MRKAEPWAAAVLVVCTVIAMSGCAGASERVRHAADDSADEVRGLNIRYVWGGGIAGKFRTIQIVTPDVSIAAVGERAEVTRVSGERAEAIIELLTRARVMDWPAGIRDRGEWNDNYHYFLDVTMDGKTRAIHAASDGPTASLAQRVQALMTKVEAEAGKQALPTRRRGATTRGAPADVPPAPLQIQEIRAQKGNLVPEGTLLETRTYYLDASGKQILHGPDIQFLENGNKWRESQYRHGKREGLLIEWDPISGDKMREESYRADRREGPAVEWRSKGRKRSECTYHDDRIVGKRLYWNAAGGLQIEEVYDEKGNLSELTVWHDNGQKAKHGTFRGVWPEVWGGPQLAGKRDGTWTYWDTSGKLVAEGEWRSGRPWDGTCVMPRRSGSLWVGEQGRYREGKVIGSVKQVMGF